MMKTGLLGVLAIVAVFAANAAAAEPAADTAAPGGSQQKTEQKVEKKAEQKSEKKPAKKVEKKKTGTYVGEVIEIDEKADKILVAPKNSSLAMVLNTTKVKKGMDDIKVGDWVEATFEAKVGTMYALTVTETKKPEESKKGTTAKQKPAGHP